MATAWEHNDLAADLAAHLRGSTDRLVWTDMQLGPMGSPRPDVYTVPKSYVRWTPMAYEVKVTRSDFRVDITTGKWMDYRKYSAGVMFAAPINLIEVRQIPDGAGLMVRGDTGWRTLQKAVFQTLDNLPLETWIKLLIDGIERQGRINQKAPRGELIKDYLDSSAIKKKFGDQIGCLLAGREHAEFQFAQETQRIAEAAGKLKQEQDRREAAARERAAKELPELSAIRQELCDLLGLRPDSRMVLIRNEAHRQMTALKRDPEVQRLQQILAMVQEALERASLPIPPLAQLKLAI